MEKKMAIFAKNKAIYAPKEIITQFAKSGPNRQN
jgi:hypothetical protein